MDVVVVVSHLSIVAHGHGGGEVLLTTNRMGRGSRTTEIRSNYLWTRFFMEPIQLSPHPGLLSIGRFALYDIQCNDLRQRL